jgi:regulator of sigma E protease
MESSRAFTYSTWSAPLVGVGLTAQITGQTFQGIGQMVWNFIHGVGSLLSFDDNARQVGRAEISAVGDSVSGPVGIIGILFPTFTSAGPANLAFLAAIISISLACMNVLPIPALDGGRWLLIAIYVFRGKKLTKETEEKIVSRAFIVLLALMFIVTILDITRFF